MGDLRERLEYRRQPCERSAADLESRLREELFASIGSGAVMPAVGTPALAPAPASPAPALPAAAGAGAPSLEDAASGGDAGPPATGCLAGGDLGILFAGMNAFRRPMVRGGLSGLMPRAAGRGR